MKTYKDFENAWEDARGEIMNSQPDEVNYAELAGILLTAIPLSLRRVWAEVPEGEDANAIAIAAVKACLEADTPRGGLAIIKGATTDHGGPRESENDWSGPIPPAREFIVPDWLPAGRVALFAGTGGRGKSRLALQLAAAIATDDDDDWLVGAPRIANDGRPVVIASWEDETAETHRRLAKIDGRTKQVENRLVAHNFAGRGSLWEPSGKEGSTHTSTKGAQTASGEWLQTYCAEFNAKLLIIDPLAAAFACNENDRGLVREFMSWWDAWAIEHDCAVMFIAHPPKSDSAWSGSTDWQAAARAVWTLDKEKVGKSKSGEDQQHGLCLKSIKQSYAKWPEPLWLTSEGAGPFRATTPERASIADDPYV